MTTDNAITIEEKIGQLCFVRFDENHINENIIHLVSNHHIGGVLLTNELFEKPKQVHHITDYLQRYAGVGRPLFIGIEGAEHPLTLSGMTQPIPHNMMEQLNNRLYTKQQAELYGKELRAVGINTIIAPNVRFDDGNPKPFVDLFRPKMQHAIAAMEGYKKAVVQSVPNVDAIIENIAASNATNKGRIRLYVDKLLKNTSALFLQGDSIHFKNNIALLRETFGFDGLIVANFHSTNVTANELIEALHDGADAFIIHDNYEKQLTLLNELTEQAKAGAILETRLENAVHRLLELKQSDGFGTIYPYDRDAFRQRMFAQLVETANNLHK